MIKKWFYHLKHPYQYTSILEYAQNNHTFIDSLPLLTQFHQEWVFKLDHCKDQSNRELRMIVLEDRSSCCFIL